MNNQKNFISNPVLNQTKKNFHFLDGTNIKGQKLQSQIYLQFIDDLTFESPCKVNVFYTKMRISLSLIF